MKVTAVIVTYANRFYLLKQVLQACLDNKVDDIVVVDNNSEKESKKGLVSFAEKYPQVHLIQNSENLGSAKGFQQGMQKAKMLANEFLWLLDDDNVPNPNTLEILQSFWKKKPFYSGALLCYRPDRPQYKTAIELDNPSYILGPENSFSGFHIIDKFRKLFKMREHAKDQVKFGKVDYAPYGGMFFQTKLLELIGYPNEELFLYSDDHEWSYRITKRNQYITLVLDATLNDIESSWAIKKRGSYFQNLKKAPSFRMYYSIRNRMWFEKNYLVTKPWIYRLNYLLFTLFVIVYSYRHPNYKVFRRAVSDANNNHLGKVL